MLKAAQESKPDLVNWLKPKLTVRRKPLNERRAVEPEDYRALVNTLLNPPLAPSRRKERNALWRDAGDVIQLLCLTGGRLNEVARMKLDQFLWTKGKVVLFASKTENERRVPLSKGIARIVQARIREDLTDGEYLFPRAKVTTFDNESLSQGGSNRDEEGGRDSLDEAMKPFIYQKISNKLLN